MTAIQEDSARWNWLWVLLIAVNLGTHLLGLGDPAMSHDEGIHAMHSYRLLDQGFYQHDPAYHGPFLYYLNALIYLLLGATDWTARLAPALAGVALVAVIRLFRRYLGEAGALAAALLVTISPSILFYGRYLRNDIYVALFALLWAYASFRYLETRRALAAGGMVLAMAASFAIKETSFLIGAVFGLFFLARGLTRSWRRIEKPKESASLQLAALMFTLVLPFCSASVFILAGWDLTHYGGPQALGRTAIALLAMVAASTVLAFLVFPRRSSQPEIGSLTLRDWAWLFLLFLALESLAFTSFFHQMSGLASGFVGSLGYWWSQHGVARGSQPVYFYLVLLLLYEILAVLLAIAGSWSILRSRSNSDQPSEPSGALPARTFGLFLLSWTLGSLLLFSLAGERMPWLLVHIALPICLLGGRWLGSVIDRAMQHSHSSNSYVLAFAAPTFLALALASIFMSQPFQGSGVESAGETVRFLIALAVLVLLIRSFWSRLQTGRSIDRSLLVLGLVLFGCLWTLRTTWMANVQHRELAVEPLVYAHGTPDIKRAMREIEELAEKTGPGRELAVAYDDLSTWPFSWYLRDYPKARFFGNQPGPDLRGAPVIIAGPETRDRLWSLVGRDYIRRSYSRVWWPVPVYAGLSWTDLGRFLQEPKVRARFWRYVLFRDLPGLTVDPWPYRDEFDLYLKEDLVVAAWPLGLEALRRYGSGKNRAEKPWNEIRVAPTLVVDAVFAGARLQTPAQVALSETGQVAIADSGNHRIVVLDRSGELLGILGGPCDLETGSGCRQEDGIGQFKEPWGIIAAGDRWIVADTWNRRIQAFSPALAPTTNRLETLVPSLFDAGDLFGARALVSTPLEGGFIVSDTGNKRLLSFDSEGRQRVQSPESLFLNEPVGLAIDQRDRSILVADTWNQRILRLDQDLESIGEWTVASWAGTDPLNKPYLAVDGQGRVYATDPNQSRVLVFSPEGEKLYALVGEGWRGQQPARPLGIAIDEDRESLWVSDGGAGKIWVLPMNPAP